MTPLTLGWQDFSETTELRVLLSDDGIGQFVSNHHWMISLGHVSHPEDFVNRGAAREWCIRVHVPNCEPIHVGSSKTSESLEKWRAAFPGALRRWTVTNQTHPSYPNRARLAVDLDGEVGGLAERYLVRLGICPGDVLYSVGPRAPFLNAPSWEEASVFLMPLIINVHRLPAPVDRATSLT